MTELQQQLFALQDETYREFHSKLMPDINKEAVIGIRIPVLRRFAGEFAKKPEAREFLQQLPHQYYEENNLPSQIPHLAHLRHYLEEKSF